MSKKANDKMARTRKQGEHASATEWSCPLCTLVNVPGDDRCMACDNKRPDAVQQRAEEVEAGTEAKAPAASGSSGPVYREAAGVFFSSAPPREPKPDANSSAPVWMREPRLAVNRRCRRTRPVRGGVTTSRRASGGDDTETIKIQVTTEMTGTSPPVVATVAAMEEEGDRRQVEDVQVDAGEDDPTMEVEEPCFSLLGAGVGIFASADPLAPEGLNVSQSDAEDNGASIGFGVPETDEEPEEMSSSPPPSPARPQFPGFMPASKVHVEERAIEDKLASAGLDLSDSEDEDVGASTRRLKRRRSREATGAIDRVQGSGSTWECDVCTALNGPGGTQCETCDSTRFSSKAAASTASEATWECDVCTNPNPPESVQCKTCDTRRIGCGTVWECDVCANMNPPESSRCKACDINRWGSERSSETSWTCSICTHVNPENYLQCKACDTKRTSAARASDSTWECNVCTNLNQLSSSCCEACQSKQPRATANTPSVPVQEWECSVCTNFNPSEVTRCEICDTPVGEGESKRDRVIDLASSPEGKPNSTSNFGFNDNDLENPYLNMSQYEEYTAVPDEPDFVEDISDNEPMPSFNRPPVVRPDLKEFEHFVCVEDLRGDMSCNVNYNQMFGGTRMRKSYSDRLAIRRTESQKRKRDAARKAQQAEVNGPPAPARRLKGKAAARAGRKKGKTTAQRRADTATKAAKNKRAKKSTAEAPRRTSTPRRNSSSINYYETSVDDLGNDMSTMAWEGIGSAGYM